MQGTSWERHKWILLEVFILTNYAFLTLDIYLAHSVNRFRHWAEWIPFDFSIVASILLATSLAFQILHSRRGSRGRSAFFKRTGLVVGCGSILVGVSGFLFHLESQFFSLFTIASLVYTAPFVAPLAYAGLGFLLLLNRIVPTRSIEWGLWIVFLALGGFLGNFVLSLCDHAQNGFFYPTEWVPVIGSALAVGFLSAALFERNRQFLGLCLGVMAVQVVIGLLGFYFHLAADINGISSSVYENFIYGAPVLAPLLFANLVLLAVLGIWDVRQSMGHGAEAGASS